MESADHRKLEAVRRMASEIQRSVERPVRPGLERAAVAATALIPMVLIVIASLRGPGMSSDSVGYAAAARNFATAGQFTYWDGLPITLWPPGLPLTLGLILRSGIDLQVAAIVLNALAAGATVALTYALGRRVLGSPRLAIVAGAILAVSVATLNVYQMLWSEPLFCTASLATLCLLAWMTQRGPSWIGVLAVAAGVSFACSLRYVGVVLVPVTGISLFVAAADRGIVRGLVAGVLGALVSAIGALAVILRNIELGAPAFGSRTVSMYSLKRAATDTLSTLGHYLLTSAGERLSIVAGLLVVALLAAGAIALAREGPEVRRAIVPILMFVGGYFTLLVGSEMTTNLNSIDPRYLSPLSGPIAVLVVAGVRALMRSARLVPWSRVPGRAGRLGPRLADRSLRGAVAVVVIAFVFGNATSAIHAVARDASDGVGDNAAAKRSSQLAPVAASLSEYMVTDDPILVYWVSGREPIVSRAVLLQSGNVASALRERVAAGDLTYYAYFYGALTLQGLSKVDLRQAGVVLHEVAGYRDGILYSLTLGPVP